MMHGGVSSASGFAFTHRVALEEGFVIGFFSRAERGIGLVRHVAPPTWLVSNVLVRLASS